MINIAVFLSCFDAEAETPMLQPPDGKNWLVCKDHDAGKIEGEGDDGEWDGWMASLMQWTWVWVSSRSLVMDREVWHVAVYGVTKSQAWPSDWTDSVVADCKDFVLSGALFKSWGPLVVQSWWIIYL